MTNDLPDVPETVGELLDEDSPEFNAPDLPGMGEADPTEGFDPRQLPGAQVMFDDGDLAVVAVPLEGVPSDRPPADGVDVLGDAVGELGDLGELFGALAGAGVVGGGGNPLFAMLEALEARKTNFRQMGWAADEINKAAERHGESDENGPIHSAFPLLACVDQPYMAPEDIFRAHCVELLDRVAKGEDTQPGTEAETLGLIVAASSDGQQLCPGLISLYLELAEKILPDVFAKFLDEETGGDRTEVDTHHDDPRVTEDREEHREELRTFHTRPRERGGRGPLPEGETEG